MKTTEQIDCKEEQVLLFKVTNRPSSGSSTRDTVIATTTFPKFQITENINPGGK